MIRLYTSKKFFEKEGITHIDAFFDNTVVRTDLKEQEEKFINKFEQAEFIDETEELLKGRFGMYPMNKISSGVKTLLVLSLISRGVIGKPSYLNVTECGNNILDYVFQLADKIDLPLILNHTELYGVKNYNFIVNDKHNVNDIVELVDILDSIRDGVL